MKKVRNILYLLSILLLLQVIKSLLSKSGFPSYYFWAMIISCLQYFLIAGSIFTLLIAWALGKKFAGRKKWIISGSIVLIIFISLEFLFTFWLNHPDYIPPAMQRSFIYYYDNFDCNLIQYEKGHSIYDSSLFYKLKPRVSFNFKNSEFDNTFMTNSLGTRDDESSLSAPEVICLGDSYIMGWGINQQETVPRRLEKLSGMKVLNAGISSYGTAREMILLNKINTSALKYLVIQYCGNDVGENEAYRNNNYKLKVSSEQLLNTKQAEEAWVRKYFPGKNFFITGSLFIRYQLNKIYPFYDLHLAREEGIKNENYQAKLFLDILFHAGINLDRVHVIVTMMDSRPHLHNDFLNQVKLLSGQLPYKGRVSNLSIADVSTVLTESDFYKLDLHIKATGHKKIAEKIFKIMKEK